ncbi:unknown [Clostridium sp. CAG:510]|nr:unknown [Clostridium sp. CAG:510]
MEEWEQNLDALKREEEELQIVRQKYRKKVDDTNEFLIECIMSANAFRQDSIERNDGTDFWEEQFLLLKEIERKNLDYQEECEERLSEELEKIEEQKEICRLDSEKIGTE